MRQFTIITKDGSKWLSRTAPHGVDPIQWHSDNLDLPYIGSHPEGTTVDESEVTELTQCRVKNAPSDKWQEIGFGKVPPPNFLFEARIAYADAEPPDIDYEKEMPHKKWPSTKYVVRKVDAESHDRHISDNPRYPLFSHMSSEHGLTLLDSELDEIARHSAPMTGVDYWKRRCQAAEKYIGQTPCDHDITPKQIEAHEAWQEIIEEGRAYGN